MVDTGNSERIQVVESVAKEKSIPRDALIAAMEQGIQVAGRRKYGNEHNIKAEINKKTGEIMLYKVLEVVEDAGEEYATKISLTDALLIKPDAQIGQEILELLPPIELGRQAASSARQVVAQRINEAEREKQYHDFKDREGDILSGIVKRIEFGNIIVDLGRSEGIIKKDQVIKGENFKINDRIKAYVQEVRHETKGPQIFLSRTDSRMIMKLFAIEVPEVADGQIEIKAAAREAGSKAKIAVWAADSSIDPVGACVGVRGSRVNAVISELHGEKIDIILWNKNIAQFVINAMAPAEISKIVLDEYNHRVEVIVAPDQLSMAIGRRGQNVKLASKITGWRIDVMTQEQQVQKNADEFKQSTALFMEKLNIDEAMAQLISAEGFTKLEQLGDADIEVLSSIDGFNEELANEIKIRANEYISSKDEEIISKLEELGVEQELLNILNLPAEETLTLAEYGIKTVEDLEEITVAEFRKLLPKLKLSDQEIERLIKNAESY